MCLRSTVVVIDCGQDDDADTPCGIVLAKSASDFKSVDRASRFLVRDDDVNARCPCEIDRAVRVRHGDHVEPNRTQIARVLLARHVVAVDQKNTC